MQSIPALEEVRSRVTTRIFEYIYFLFVPSRTYLEFLLAFLFASSILDILRHHKNLGIRNPRFLWCQRRGCSSSGG
jgi:hypothetical protein